MSSDRLPRALAGERSVIDWDDDDEPTRPEGLQARAAMLVRNWRELPEAEKRHFEKLIELAAWAKTQSR